MARAKQLRRRSDTGRATGSGLPIDFAGGPTIDPTENVKDLSEALSRRQDDLRDINNQYILQRVIAVEEVAKLRAEHAKEINELNNDRLEKIRAVDNLNATRSEERAGEGIKALAVQTAAIAEAGRTTAANTAAQIATQLTTLFAESNKRLSALELAMSEGRGKQAVADPQMERLALMVEQLAARETKQTGKTEGMSDLWKLIVAGAALLGALNALGVFNRSPSPVYTPAPYGTQLPTTPPAAVPR